MDACDGGDLYPVGLTAYWPTPDRAVTHHDSSEEWKAVDAFADATRIHTFTTLTGTSNQAYPGLRSWGINPPA